MNGGLSATLSARELDRLCVNTIRFLAVDAVQKANCGHPGAADGRGADGLRPVDAPPQHNPANPDWPDRDRFVLSAGHGSMLLYALLHLTGYDLPLDELKHSASGAAGRPATRSAA